MLSLFSPRCGSLWTPPRTVYANNETQYYRLRGSDTQNIRLEGEHQGYPMNSDATSHQSPRHHMSRDDDTTSQSGTICARNHNKKTWASSNKTQSITYNYYYYTHTYTANFLSCLVSYSILLFILLKFCVFSSGAHMQPSRIFWGKLKYILVPRVGKQMALVV